MRKAPNSARLRVASPAPHTVVLRPGEYFVGDRRYRVATLLGSCVSVTLWHPALRVGAMCHYLLATRPSSSSGHTRDARYGEDALALMLSELVRLGVPPTECEGKLFGGGDMFPEQQKAQQFEIGLKNGEAARRLLDAQGIPIKSESLYGASHRKIIFVVATGDVWVSKPAMPRGLKKSEGSNA